jgi:hypothetical protein
MVQHERIQEIVADLRLLARGPLKRRWLKLEGVQEQKTRRSDTRDQQPAGARISATTLDSAGPRAATGKTLTA